MEEVHHANENIISEGVVKDVLEEVFISWRRMVKAFLVFEMAMFVACRH
jgi:hypothetical protein